MTRRGMVISVVLIVATLAASWALSGETSQGGGLSSFQSGPAGGKALADLYIAAGRPVTRLQASFTRDHLGRLAPGTVLFVMAPRLELSPDEARVARDWVEEGGTMVLVPSDARKLQLGTLFPNLALADGDTEALSPAGAAPEAVGWRRLAPASRSLQPPSEAITVAASPGGVGVAALTLGSGRVVALADEALATATWLRQDDGVAFALALAPGPVAFDEFHHGFQADEERGLGARFGLIVFQLLAVALVVFLARGRRRAPPRLETEDRPLSRAAFADALAENLRGADGREAALDLMRVDLRRLLRFRTLAPPDEPDGDLSRRAQAAGIDVGEALLAPAADESAFLLRSRQVAEAVARLRGAGSQRPDGAVAVARPYPSQEERA